MLLIPLVFRQRVATNLASMSDQEEPVGSVSKIQGVLADLDPSALCTGFVAVVEWIEEDGTSTLSMLHSPMPPWHLQGMLNHAARFHEMPTVMLGEDDELDLEE